jgi:hypothetical protein
MQSRRRVPPTPPGGLNIATEQERKQVENLKKAQYRDELLKVQLFLEKYVNHHIYITLFTIFLEYFSIETFIVVTHKLNCLVQDFFTL